MSVGVSFAFRTFAVTFAIVPLVLAIAFDGHETFVPPPGEAASFLSVVRRTLAGRGYLHESCECGRFSFRSSRVLGKRLVVDVSGDAVRIAGPSPDVDALVAVVLMGAPPDDAGPLTVYRGAHFS